MWIASQIGFFSIVQKDGFFHVRSRLRADLENLRRASKVRVRIEQWPQADYRFRMRVDAAALSRIFGALERSVDYPNFKSRIAQSADQRDKLAAYEKLWFDLFRLQSAHENLDHEEHDHTRAETHPG